MRIIYKSIKVPTAHCSICGERLFGNGSLLTPYQCKCGVWETKDWNNPSELTLKKKLPVGNVEDWKKGDA